MKYEKETGIYISPEATSTVARTLRSLSIGRFKNLDDDQAIKAVSRGVKIYCNK